MQSTYSYKRKKFSNTYTLNEKIEDVIVLQTNNTLTDWQTPKSYEQRKDENSQANIFARLKNSRKFQNATDTTNNLTATNSSATAVNKALMAKLSANMTIINNNNSANTALGNALMQSSQNSNMSTSTISDDGKLQQTSSTAVAVNDENSVAQALPSKAILKNTRVIYNKAIDAIQATGHLKGFTKAAILTDSTPAQSQPSPSAILFGFYCVRWRRAGSNAENETKFYIGGLPIVEPPLNIYCSIEEKMFVKMPMTFKVVLKNPTSHVMHLIATLNINNTNNFICSGHKQVSPSVPSRI